MPGIGRVDENGKSAISGLAFVSAASRDDFPVFGGPTITALPAPSTFIA